MRADNAAAIVRDRDGPPVEARSAAAWKSGIICALLALAVWAVFGQTIRFDFINYDDDAVVYDNPAVTQGLDLGEIGHVLTHASGRDSWFPITDISHMADWQFYGPNASGHHFTNVLLHAATAIVLFLAFEAMTGARWRSAFAAAAFALHPLRVESVAWVAERKDVLSGLFFMLALWNWVRNLQARPSFQQPSSAIAAADPRRWSSRYYYALAFFILALLSKSMVVTLPLLLLVLDFWPLERFKTTSFARLILEKWPFFLSSAGGCVVTLLTQAHVVLAADHFGRLWRLGNALMAYADYLGHMIYPVGLELLYPPPPAHLSAEKLCISVIVLLGISAVTILARRKQPWLLSGWLWYLIAFLPVIDIMQTGDQARADRYTYLPQIGLTFLVAWEAAALARALPFRRIALGCAAAAVLVALSAAAHAQVRFWKNSVSIWSRTLSLWPGSHVAHCNLGIALADQGEATEALGQFHRALQIDPRDAKSMNNLGKLLTTEGKLNGAIGDFHEALKLAPDDARILDNLSVALAAQGKVDDALRELEQALKVQPEDANTYYNLGNLYGSRGDYDDATQNYEHALEINDDFAEAHCNLGLILARQGNADAAIAQYERALRLKPHYLDALNDLGGALTAEGDLGDAAIQYRQALALKPHDPNMLNNLGVILARQGKLDDALDCFHRALQFDPNNASSYNNLGIALASQGKMAQAIENLQQALALARARNNVELEDSIQSRLQRYQNAPPADREILKKF